MLMSAQYGVGQTTFLYFCCHKYYLTFFHPNTYHHTLMKKALVCLSFLFAFGMATANAQCAASAGSGKSCCASKMAKAASADPSIEKQTAADGSVSYVRKQTDGQGNVQFVSVKYDEVVAAFVNVAPPATAGMTKKEASCSAAEKKACAAGGEKKACCAGGAKKSCAGMAAKEEQ